MSAPVFLLRCPRCFGFHPWRAAKYEAHTAERIAPHQCQHGRACTVDCEHGHPMGLGCCAITVQDCAQCVEARSQVYAKKPPRPECLVCREVKRQGGSGCPTFKTRKEGDWTHSVPDPFCKWRRLERMPPWCAGATDVERKLFVTAIPGEVREKAIEEARKANRQESAEQRYEKKAIEKKKPTGQTSMF